MENEIFTIRARRCLRCGRLLTSTQAVTDGYGCRCKELSDFESKGAEPIPGQMSIDDFLNNKEVNDERSY